MGLNILNFVFIDNLFNKLLKWNNKTIQYDWIEM